MKVTQLDTLRLGEYSNVLWVLVRTDEGLTGLGETFLGAEAVEAYVHESVAPTKRPPAPVWRLSPRKQNARPPATRSTPRVRKRSAKAPLSRR